MKQHHSADPLVSFARGYLNMPVPDVFELRSGLDFLEQQLGTENPDYVALYRFADSLTSTMSFRASTAQICEFILHERRDQLWRMVDCSAENNPDKAFPVLREILRGSYAAIDFTRSGRPGRALYERITTWQYEEAASEISEGSIAGFRSILGEVLADVARTAERRNNA
jgi:hypothetical protein